MKKLGLMVSMWVMLNGCSMQYTSNGEQKYVRSRNGANLVIPPPLTGENISHFYDLPPQPQDPRVSIAPPANQ